MTTAQRITQLSGISPSECGCEKCKQMCRTPCLGTPEDIERLAIAGYADRLCLSLWCVGKMAGLTDKPLTIVAPRQEPDGWCTFRLPDGRCELHDKGLKPLEGKLATCRPRPADWTIDKDITWLVAKEWLPLQDQINRITNR